MPRIAESAGREALTRLRELVQAPADLKTRLMLLRQLLESVYRTLSQDSQTGFSGLFARMQYVHSQLNAPPELVAQINQLRLLCNQATHEDQFQPQAQNWLNGVHAMRELLCWLEPGQCDPELDAILREQGAQAFPAAAHKPKASFSCVAAQWKLLRQSGQVSGLELTAYDEQGQLCSIMLNNGQGAGRRWSDLNKVLWEFCLLLCRNLTPVTGRERAYMSNPLTMIVVEPDFLIDATAVAECFDSSGAHPEYFVISHLLKEPAADKMIKGIMVNNILDELTSDPRQEYQELFRRALAKLPIAMVALQKEAALGIYNSIRNEHFPGIKAFAASLRDAHVQLEPSYISPEYGLQGRLDILFSQGGKQHIVELKSGNPSQHDVWPQHQMQVVAYNLILASGGQRRNLGHSSILYSAAGADNNLRRVVNTLETELNLLMCRNRLVGVMRGLATDPAVFFDWLLKQQTQPGKDFRQSGLQLIIDTLRGISPLEYEWFLGQLRLAMREIWFEKTGGLGRDSIYGHNSLWQESVAAKRDRYRILSSLRVRSITFSTVTLSLPEELLVTDFRAEDIVVLYRQNTPVSRQELLRGHIVRLDEREVEVAVRGGMRNLPEQYNSELWALEHDILETSLYSPLAAIFSFLRAEPEQRQLWLGVREARSDAGSGAADADNDEVLQRLLSSREYHIVQGPPGTGKTSGLLASYIRAVYSNTDKNILILSFTNRAVDEICLNLRRQDIPFIRTGHSAEIANELLNNLIEGRKYDEITAIIGSCRVWVATVQSCSSWLPDLLKLMRFHELVIDEASQIVENSILGIITRADKVVLIGDQNQLPPISRQTDQGFAYQAPQLRDLCYDSYSQSLMERLCRVCAKRGWERPVTMLRRHYRMHEEIAQLIQPYYSHQLVAVSERQRDPLAESGHELLVARLVWIDYPPSRFAYYDPRQAEGILALLDLLFGEGIVRDPEADIGIVAPFRAMIHILLKELPPERKNITIDTVERFQGSERKNIIITLPLHSQAALRNIEALSADKAVDRKLNVAVSRAQERIFVFGCRELCRGSEHYKLLVDKIAASGRVFTASDIFKEKP